MANRRARFTLADLQKSKVASINQEVFEETKKPEKKKGGAFPKGPCLQVQWMWSQLAWWSLSTGIEVVREFKFHPERKWRFDFAIPSKLIACEYNGVQSAKSRHTTLTGYTGDREKINAAVGLKWRVLEFTVLNYKKVLTEVNKLIEL